ncbi:unnamed protein product [Cyprideis torosa]|uniref:Uncharacterized protein n=1 Tax=Cyprideis torosa TaxID=163714 RepID=A0A7R8W9W1_9CRUS|nr:unnamed protein product [Cyprideis torosa]CAG0890223.1 unnamed protein product [Cyprideis torosa]
MDQCGQEAMEVDDGEETSLSENDESTNSSETESSGSDSSSFDLEGTDHALENLVELIRRTETEFNDLKDVLYETRLQILEESLDAVQKGTSESYLKPLKELEKGLEQKLEIAENRKVFRLAKLKLETDAEKLSTHQQFENDKEIVRDEIRGEIELKIRNLEEDRCLAQDFLARSGSPQRSSSWQVRKKPIIVRGPYIVYMLDEADILEDVKAMKEFIAMAAS